MDVRRHADMPWGLRRAAGQATAWCHRPSADPMARRRGRTVLRAWFRISGPLPRRKLHHADAELWAVLAAKCGHGLSRAAPSHLPSGLAGTSFRSTPAHGRRPRARKLAHRRDGAQVDYFEAGAGQQSRAAPVQTSVGAYGYRVRRHVMQEPHRVPPSPYRSPTGSDQNPSPSIRPAATRGGPLQPAVVGVAKESTPVTASKEEVASGMSVRDAWCRSPRALGFGDGRQPSGGVDPTTFAPRCPYRRRAQPRRTRVEDVRPGPTSGPPRSARTTGGRAARWNRPSPAPGTPGDGRFLPAHHSPGCRGGLEPSPLGRRSTERWPPAPAALRGHPAGDRRAVAPNGDPTRPRVTRPKTDRGRRAQVRARGRRRVSQPFGRSPPRSGVP